MTLDYRTVFISDTHLGSRGCQAEALSRFIKYVRCERLYLVGDIVDMWRLKQRWYWPGEHNNVLRRILNQTKHGTDVVFVPGNHDEAAAAVSARRLRRHPRPALRRPRRRRRPPPAGDPRRPVRPGRQTLPLRLHARQQGLRHADPPQLAVEPRPPAAGPALPVAEARTSRAASNPHACSSAGSRRRWPVRPNAAASTGSCAATSTSPPHATA